ncbi:uncharacterized protein GLRG_02388 [Colletotrichum graminicola M1.001]|uniref:Uncharacterized protein n=1 Tax=Colletotrichum graminicola (strain M1.001 / M2 / FGSC 10212) TaxID=645133 RepID=E3Q6T0_COLGM|nr:uncharacterized protein GLRG_02388 [Colletotrichum graminicola M1.001]EFQ26568.1 hypothetical protein GLRG_02388 [Colletotrichum graminicola M1.001]
MAGIGLVIAHAYLPEAARRTFVVGALLPARLDTDVRVTMLGLNSHSVELLGLSSLACLGDLPHLVCPRSL